MPLKDFTLLFVEDDLTTQEQMKMLLEDDVKEFFQANDGSEGFDAFIDKRPDIILSDINMPSSGLDMVKKIKAVDKNVPIIMMSAFDDKENLLASINLCTNGFVTKPIDMDLLYEQLHKVASYLQTQKRIDTQEKEKIEDLYKLAHYDTLTNVANRFLFNLELDKSIKQSKLDGSHFALFFIDLDHFKDINDTYGHEVGDLVLQSVVETISEHINPDDVLARRSGDEFLLILNNSPHSLYLEDLASDILNTLNVSTLHNGISIKISCSIGISMFPKSTEDKSELLRLADVAMYFAKNSGKNRYCFADTALKEIATIQEKHTIVINKEFYWNTEHSYLIYQDEEIYLTKNEILFLTSLFSSPNYRATYETIYTYIWGMSGELKIGSIKTLVKVLRKKLPFNIIKNIFGIGYKIDM